MRTPPPSDLQYLPVHRYARDPYQQTAWERREAARRKAEQRERQRARGMPDAATVERALVDALRIYLTRDNTTLQRILDPAAVLLYARNLVLSRSYVAHEQDPEKPRYEPAAVVEAIRRRVMVPPRTSF
ncbi:hypothetical protein [Methylobacterium sp. MA0201]|uniref:hypothetical protein n=1 Tax=Methylobacterium alsaeris TaxID=3344826 RepID=UPI0037583565